jgi:RND family efflux transporter MFP subunit
VGIVVLLLSLLLASCHRRPPPAPPPPVVRVAIAQVRAVEQTQEWLATLDGSVNAEIRPRVAGTMEEVVYPEGSTVHHGTLLFRIDRRPFAASLARAQGEYRTALAQLAKARADVARYTPLVAEHAISHQELDNARAATAAGEATAAALKGALALAQLDLQWTEVRSPIDGLAGIAQVRVGNLVDSNTVLTVVSTLDPVRASINISEREYLDYAEILNNVNDPRYASQRYLELRLIDGRRHPYGARRVVVNRQINPGTGTLLVQALFPNPGNILRPGMFATLQAHEGARPALLIPEVAVQELQGQYRVGIVDDQQRVQVRPVELGRLVQHEYVIRRGLRPGDRVIVSGLQNARPGTPVRVEESRPPTLGQAGPEE